MIDSQVVTTIKVERERGRGLYPDSLAKTHNAPTAPSRNDFKTNFAINKTLFESILNNGLTLSCNVGYIKGNCVNGHRYLKAVFCGKEWCENCGQDGSPSHIRRMGRWMPKINQMQSMGYLVITIPEAAREHFKTPEALTDFRTFVKRKLQRDGYKRGLIRYHYFGDCNKCNGRGCIDCKGTAVSSKYHPHLNVFIEGGAIPKARFKKYFGEWRKSLQTFFYKYTGIDNLTGNLHYQHTTIDAKKTHLLKYVTRATHRNFNKEIAKNLKGYRTTSTWGKWEKGNHHAAPEAGGQEDITPELINIVNGICPCCAEPIKWDTGYYVDNPDTGGKKYKRTIVRLKQLKLPGYDMEHIQAGYYILKPNIYNN